MENRISAEFYGVHEGIDSTDALQKAIDDVGEKAIELILPGYDIKISRPIIGRANHYCISGYGRLSRIVATDIGFTALTLGPGENINTQGNHLGGYIKDFSILGPTKAPADGSAGLLLDNIRFLRVMSIESNGFNFGFDLIRNCFGSSFYKPRTHFGDNRIGILLRGEKNGMWGSGSDIPIYNGWFGGVEAAVWVNPNGGGYNFYSGQMAMGYGLTEDRGDLGCIVIGKNYQDGTIGGSGIIRIEGMDFEGWKRAYAIRGYGRCLTKAEGISFTASDKEQMAMGIIKVTDGENGIWSLGVNGLKGNYSQSKLASLQYSGSSFTFHEEPNLPDYNCFAAGERIKAVQSLTSQSKLKSGTVSGRANGKSYVGMDNMYFSTTGIGEPQVSFDWGETWRSLSSYKKGESAPNFPASYIGEK
jgi:hypothetical protein